MKPLPSICALLLLLVVAGCVSSHQGRITTEQEEQLCLAAVTPEQARLVVTARKSGTVVRWREMATPENPVTVPLIQHQDSSHQPVIRVRLNAGQPVELVVDTGAPMNLLDAETVLANHVTVVQPERLRNAFRGLGGLEETWFGLVQQMTIGSELAFRNVFTAIRIMHHERRGLFTVRRWTGSSVGMSSLAQFAYLTLDYPGRYAIFSYRDYFTEPTNAVANAPLQLADAQLRVPLKFAGREITALLDTGNDAGLMLSSNLVAELGWQKLAARGKKEKYVGLGGAMTLRSFKVPELRIGETTFKNVDAVSGPPEFGVVLGSGFLHRYRATVDLRRKQLWLEKSVPKRR